MYEVQICIYRLTEVLWRWEVRWGQTLIRCGTTRSRAAAENEVTGFVEV
jgi:hypothetical protein